MAVKRVAVIGAGPAGAIAVDALSREQTFDLIRGFERREGPGGCWIGDTTPPPVLTNFEALASRTADQPVPVPSELPAVTAKTEQPRFTESSIYPYLETNVDSLAMEYTEEPIPEVRSAWSIATHGPDTPFRPWRVLRDYVAGLLSRRGYEGVFSHGTTVERAEKTGNEWRLTLRREKDGQDEWWAETFDAVVVASGHYSVPYVPAVEGLAAWQQRFPGSIVHSKQYRGREAFAGKRVVVVGASVSAADIAVDLLQSAQLPVHVVVLGHAANGYFGDVAFEHPSMKKETSLVRVDAETRTAFFADGTFVKGIDCFVFGTGYSWTLPFLPQIPVRNNRVPGLWQHVVWQQDVSLVFVGAVNAGLTFKIFEWQAVYAARVLAGRGRVPSLEEMQSWEAQRIAERGDGPRFSLVFPEFEEYFETLRRLSGGGPGRALPRFEQRWYEAFMEGHERRKAMWRRSNGE